MLVHQKGGELRRLVDRAREVVATMLTHLDADAVIIARSIEVSMFALLIRRQVLDGQIVLNREVPGEKADAIPAFALCRAQCTALQRQRVIVGSASRILRGVNRD